MEIVLSVIAIGSVLAMSWRIANVEDRIRHLRMSHDCLEARVMVMQSSIVALAESVNEDDEELTLGPNVLCNSDYEPIG